VKNYNDVKAGDQIEVFERIEVQRSGNGAPERRRIVTREYSRSLRVAEQIQRELARLDPDRGQGSALGMVSISEVRVSNDLAHAKVYITVIGSDAEARRSRVGS
jgi:hypothetical protein